MSDNQSTESSQKKQREALPEATERALLKVLLDKTKPQPKFKDICNNRPHLFGSRASELRRKVQHRRQYLLSNPDYLQLAVSTLLRGGEEESAKLLEQEEEEGGPLGFDISDDAILSSPLSILSSSRKTTTTPANQEAK
jgi:hypothetical protein